MQQYLGRADLFVPGEDQGNQREAGHIGAEAH